MNATHFFEVLKVLDYLAFSMGLHDPTYFVQFVHNINLFNKSFL